jgi:SAM-dependent methyltransferase
VTSIYRDGTYLRAHPGWHEEDSPWKADKILRMIEKHRLAPSTITEVGCGSGEILVRLARGLPDGTVFTGYEISPQAFAICQGKSTANLRFFLADMPTEDSPADLILAIDVFEHVEDYLGFLSRLRTCGQLKLFHIPLDLSVQSVLRRSRLLAARRRTGHLHYFTKETALASLEDTGYEVLDWFYTKGTIELPHRGMRATLLKVPRRVLFALNQDLAARVLGGFSIMVLAR